MAVDVLAFALFGVEALVGPSVSDSESLSNCLLLLYCWNVHVELCKLNRYSELMYVQAVLPMDMARGLRGLSRCLVTKEQKNYTVGGPWGLSCRSDGQKSEANKIGIQTSGCRVRVL